MKLEAHWAKPSGLGTNDSLVEPPRRSDSRFVVSLLTPTFQMRTEAQSPALLELPFKALQDHFRQTAGLLYALGIGS